MTGLRVSDVMTHQVVVATTGCRTGQIIDVLTDYGVSGLPVVDDDDRVVGVVSEADLLRAVAGHTAAQFMSAPAVTIRPEQSVEDAVRLMADRGIKRLPVVEAGSGRLLGILTRGDLLRRTLRSDRAIECEIVDEVVQPAFAVDPEGIAVDVAGGVVTLRGTVERRSAALLMAARARTVDGVTGVRNELRWRVDDTVARRPAPGRRSPLNPTGPSARRVAP